MAGTMAAMRAATLAYFPLKGDCNDYSGNGNDGTASGGLTYVPGICGSAANFPTSGASVQVPLDGFDRYAQKYCLSAWVNISENAPLPGENGAAGVIAGDLQFSYDTGSVFYIFRYDSPSSPDNQTYDLVSSTVLSPGVWYNVLVMYDHSTLTLELYINGLIDTQASLAGQVSPSDRPQLPVPYNIGSYGAIPWPSTLNGSVSDVVLLNDTVHQCCLNCLGGLMCQTILADDQQRDVEGPEAFVVFFILPVFTLACLYSYVKLYHYAENQPSAPSEKWANAIAAAVTGIVGAPAVAGQQATRQAIQNAIGLPIKQRVHVDIGGLGAYVHPQGTLCGFKGAVNVNAVTTNPDSTPPNQAVPNLVLVPAWSTNPPYPFGDQFADYITMQSAPLTSTNVAEMARILRPGGVIGLWIDQAAYQTQIDQLASLLNCTPVPCTVANGNLDMDEFQGRYVFPKLVLDTLVLDTKVPPTRS